MVLVGPQEISHIVNGDETVLFTSGAVGTGYARVSAQCAFEEGSNEVTCTSIKLLYHCGQRLSGWMNLFDGKCSKTPNQRYIQAFIKLSTFENDIEEIQKKY